MFFKKKKKAEKQEQVTISPEQAAEIRQIIEDKEHDLSSSENESRVDELNEIASLYQEINDIDNAIRCYEESLELKPALGKASTSLMKLYNIKRRQAAENKDDAAVKEYMDKINSLMTLSKDVIRGRV